MLYRANYEMVYANKGRTMSERVLMKCGCVAQGMLTHSGGKKLDPPIPVCVIHDCTEVADTVPDLTGRMSRCLYGEKKGGNYPSIAPSSFDLPFFKYKGPDSECARETCICGYKRVAHGKPHIKCKEFVAHGPYEYDEHYCGCHGWN